MFIKVGMGKLIKIRDEKLIFIELGIRMFVFGIMDSQVDIFRIRDGQLDIFVSKDVDIFRVRNK